MSSIRATLRQHYKTRRRALDAHTRASATAGIAMHLDAFLDGLTGAGGLPVVGAFLATSDEVNLRDWMSAYLARGGRIALPRVGARGAMTFHAFDADTALTPNRYGIDEPVQASPAVEAGALDVIAVPLVAFHSSGTRLGMGGGYYDRYLVGVRADAVKLGVAFAAQESREPLPSDSWDVPLHAVVTENGVLECG